MLNFYLEGRAQLDELCSRAEGVRARVADLRVRGRRGSEGWGLEGEGSERECAVTVIGEGLEDLRV